MPRCLRLVLPDVPLHIIQRGINRTNCFFSDADYRVYLAMLHQCAGDSGCSVHAYVLMTNHVHLLISPHHAGGPASLMKTLGQGYVQYVNRQHRRTGTLWDGRYRSCLVDDDRYLLVCQRYIELNPVRAQMVTHPDNYEWSSYRANAAGVENSLITPHAVYAGLAPEQAQREAAYRELFCERLPAQVIEQVRHATNGNFALRDYRFANAMTEESGGGLTPREADD